MGIDNRQAPPLLGYHFCVIKHNEGEPPFIQCTGQLVAADGDMYLANFFFPSGPPYSRLITREEISAYTLFPRHEALDDFIQAFHREFGIQASNDDIGFDEEGNPVVPCGTGDSDTVYGETNWGDTDTGVPDTGDPLLEGLDADGNDIEATPRAENAFEPAAATNVIPMSMSKLNADADQGEGADNPSVA